jgi:hypothetical protein
LPIIAKRTQRLFDHKTLIGLVIDDQNGVSHIVYLGGPWNDCFCMISLAYALVTGKM